MLKMLKKFNKNQIELSYVLAIGIISISMLVHSSFKSGSLETPKVSKAVQPSMSAETDKVVSSGFDRMADSYGRSSNSDLEGTIRNFNPAEYAAMKYESKGSLGTGGSDTVGEYLGRTYNSTNAGQPANSGTGGESVFSSTGLGITGSDAADESPEQAEDTAVPGTDTASDPIPDTSGTDTASDPIPDTSGTDATSNPVPDTSGTDTASNPVPDTSGGGGSSGGRDYGDLLLPEYYKMLSGMKIENDYVSNGAFLVTTTSARFEYNNLELKIYQGLGADKRLLATMKFNQSASFAKVESTNDKVLFWSEHFNIGIYGDSTCFIRAKQNCNLTLKHSFTPAFHEVSDERAVLSDILGGLIISPQLNGSGFSIKEQGKDLQINLASAQVMIFRTFSTISDKASLLSNTQNPQAIKEVAQGKRTVANAAWWGFDSEDSTNAIQEAINSKALKVIIPYMGNDWIVKQILLQSNKEIYIESGVNIVAKKGEFRKTGDCLFIAVNKSNIKISGYNATLKMQKQDYLESGYSKGEWRMGISLLSCNGVEIEGLIIRDTGGDGLYVSGSERAGVCKNIEVKDCIFDNNYRQGISIISVEGLNIDNCIFRNTSGTPPCAGVDIEPNRKENIASNIVITNCKSENNDGAGFVVSLMNLDKTSKAISILIYNSYVIGCKWGMLVGSTNSSGPAGIVEFRDCTAENTISDGIRVEVDTRAFGINFRNCKLRNVANSLESPVTIRVKRYNETSSNPMPIILEDISVYDGKNRQAFKFRAWPYELSSLGLNVNGAINVHNKLAEKTDLGLDKNNVKIGVQYLSEQ